MSSLPTLKVVVAGDGAVGKTSLIRRYSEGKFEISRVATIGVDFQIQRVRLPRGMVKLSIWDMAGQERFQSIRTVLYRGSRCAALVYDVTHIASLASLPRWRDEILGAVPGERFVVVANKIDLPPPREGGAGAAPRPINEREAARKFAASIGAAFVETSALSGRGVPELFEALARLAVEGPARLAPS